MLASSVSVSDLPGTSRWVSVIETGWPIASLTTRRWPECPLSVEFNEYSSPDNPAPSVPTTPSTCAASDVRGYTRRITGVPVMPAMFSASTDCAAFAGKERAR